MSLSLSFDFSPPVISFSYVHFLKFTFALWNDLLKRQKSSVSIPCFFITTPKNPSILETCLILSIICLPSSKRSLPPPLQSEYLFFSNWPSTMLNLFTSKSKQNANRLAEEGCSRNSSTTQLPPEEAQRPRSEYGEPPGTPNTLVQVPSNFTNQDLPAVADEELTDEKQYQRFSPARKISIVSIISYCAFLAPISSTAILIAVPEVGKTFGTNGDIINASNALYLAFMGISATFWGPISQVWGRRPVSSRLCQKQYHFRTSH